MRRWQWDSRRLFYPAIASVHRGLVIGQTLHAVVSHAVVWLDATDARATTSLRAGGGRHRQRHVQNGGIAIARAHHNGLGGAGIGVRAKLQKIHTQVERGARAAVPNTEIFTDRRLALVGAVTGKQAERSFTS